MRLTKQRQTPLAMQSAPIGQLGRATRFKHGNVPVRLRLGAPRVGE